MFCLGKRDKSLCFYRFLELSPLNIFELIFGDSRIFNAKVLQALYDHDKEIYEHKMYFG